MRVIAQSGAGAGPGRTETKTVSENSETGKGNSKTVSRTAEREHRGTTAEPLSPQLGYISSQTALEGLYLNPSDGLLQGDIYSFK